jgi:hypothetical protein
MPEIRKGSGLDDLLDAWFAYIALDDIDARLEKVAVSGGAIERPAFDIPGLRRIAVLRDKAGSAIGWITPASDACVSSLASWMFFIWRAGLPRLQRRSVINRSHAHGKTPRENRCLFWQKSASLA